MRNYLSEYPIEWVSESIGILTFSNKALAIDFVMDLYAKSIEDSWTGFQQYKLPSNCYQVFLITETDIVELDVRWGE